MALIASFADFAQFIREAGFSLGGGNPHGIFTYGEHLAPNIRWHTGDPQTDPWAWRIRAVEECGDIAYAKLFLGISGYIHRDFYPDFLAVRRGGLSLDDLYKKGEISSLCRRVYRVIETSGPTAMHDVKSLAGVSKEEALRYERSLVELQARMFITVCGQAQRISRKGETYGWYSAVFCTTEQFFPQAFEEAAGIDRKDAAARIKARILEMNPQAGEKDIRKFIG